MDIDPIRRAHQAKRELAETDAAFASVRQAMIDELLRTTPTDTAKRESLYLGVQALDAVKLALRQVIDGGKIEEAVQEMTRSHAG